MRMVLVTGANGNLGNALVKQFSEREWKVIAMVSPKANNEMFAGLNNVELCRADAVSETEVRSAIEKYAQVDAAVLTIGGYAGGKISETTTEQIQEMMRLNFFTAWNFAKPLFENMMAKQKGNIVLIGSQAGTLLTEGTYAVAYSIAKTALAKLAALLNEAGKKKNVFCSLVSPATLDTPQNRKAMPGADFSQWQKPYAVAEEIVKMINR